MDTVAILKKLDTEQDVNRSIKKGTRKIGKN